MPPKESLKRKDPPQSNGRQGRDPKRNKVQESRQILAQPAHRILNENGELDVGSFVKARQFEIEALEQGIKNSKHGLSTRAFQQVPRQLRRRTASHNVKKIPKRLRARAAKEIREDNTPTGSARKKDLTSKQHIRRGTAEKAAKIGAKVKQQREALEKAQAEEQSQSVEGGDDTQVKSAPALAEPVHAPQPKKDTILKAPKPVTKFRKRQKDKTWLPTHIFHAKRAHMTTPSEPLWRFAIPLSPTEKVYRITHRAANTRGCVAWDMSYMSTIMLEGTEHSLIYTLRRMGVPGQQLDGKQGLNWRRGVRSWGGWLKEANERQLWITNVSLIWCVQETDYLADLEDDEKGLAPVKRSILLRTHPAGFLQLWTELLRVGKEQRPALRVEDLRFVVGSIEVTGPQASEALAGVLHEMPRKKLGGSYTSEVKWPAFARAEPRSLPDGALLNLNVMDPRLRHPPRTVSLADSDEDVLDLMANWTGDDTNTSGPLFDRDARFASCTLQSSQKAINRRKGDSDPGEYPLSLSSDPQIPALLYASASGEGKTRQSSWTLMLPWDWVLPFWYSLMYYPLSTGGNPRFAGLDEKRQLFFEQDAPWFPADFPGTRAGWNWELREQAKREREWKKRPKAKRIEWTSIDLGAGRKGEVGRGWACDWHHLFGIEVQNEDAVTDKKEAREKARQEKEDQKTNKNVSLPDGVEQVFAGSLADSKYSPSERTLLTVSVRLLHRGVPTTCARIYRLPTNDEELKSRWLALAQTRSGKAQQEPCKQSLNARSDASEYPIVPGEVDLIGFVTTGNFNLAEGRGTGIGSIALKKVWGDDGVGSVGKAKGLCIIREAGNPTGRLAEWCAL